MLDASIAKASGHMVVSVHTDISTVIGERILVFILNGTMPSRTAQG